MKFKSNAQPIFRSARLVQFAMEADLEEEYNKLFPKEYGKPHNFVNMEPQWYLSKRRYKKDKRSPK